MTNQENCNNYDYCNSYEKLDSSELKCEDNIIQMRNDPPASAPIKSVCFDFMSPMTLTESVQNLYPKYCENLLIRQNDNYIINITKQWHRYIDLKWLEIDRHHDSDQLRRLVETYAEQTRKAIIYRQEIDDFVKFSEKQQLVVWKTVSKSLEKSGKCADNQTVKIVHTYETNEFDEEQCKILQTTLNKLRTTCTENFYVHSAMIARLELDAYIYFVCENPRADLIKQAVKQLWGYTKFGESDIVHRDVRRWLNYIIAAWHRIWVVGNIQGLLEIVALAFQSQSTWTATFIQIPSTCLDLVMTSLYIILQKPEEKSTTNEEEWLVIDCFGQVESRVEKVLLAFLDQIPLQAAVYNVLCDTKETIDVGYFVACIEHIRSNLEYVCKVYPTCYGLQDRLAIILIQIAHIVGNNFKVKSNGNILYEYDAVIVHCTKLFISSKRLLKFAASLPFDCISSSAAATCAFVIRNDEVQQQIEILGNPHHFFSTLVNVCKHHPLQMASAVTLDVIEYCVLKNDETKLAITLLTELISVTPDIVLNTILRLSLKFSKQLYGLWVNLPLESWNNVETKHLSDLFELDKAIGQIILSNLPWRYFSSNLHTWVFDILKKELHPQTWVWKIAVQLHLIEIPELEDASKSHLSNMFHFLTCIKKSDFIDNDMVIKLINICHSLMESGYVIAVLKCLDGLFRHPLNLSKRFCNEVIKKLLLDPESSKLLKSIIIGHIIAEPSMALWWANILLSITDWFIIPEILNAFDDLCSVCYRYLPDDVKFFDNFVGTVNLELYPKNSFFNTVGSWFSSSKSSTSEIRQYLAFFWVTTKLKLEEEKWKKINLIESPKKCFNKVGLEKSALFELAEVILLLNNQDVMLQTFLKELVKHETAASLLLKTNVKLHKRLKERLESWTDLVKWLENPKLNRAPEIRNTVNFEEFDKRLKFNCKPWKIFIEPVYESAPVDKPTSISPLENFRRHVTIEQENIKPQIKPNWVHPPIEKININVSNDAFLANCRTSIDILVDSASRACGRSAKLLILDLDLTEELLPKRYCKVSEKITRSKECSSMLAFKSCSGPAAINFEIEINTEKEYIRNQIKNNRADFSFLVKECIEKPSPSVCSAVTKLGRVCDDLISVITTTVSITERELVASKAMELLVYISSRLNDETNIWPPTKHLFLNILLKLAPIIVTIVKNGLYYIMKCIMYAPKMLSSTLSSAFVVNNYPEEFSYYYEEIQHLSISYGSIHAKPLLNNFDVDNWLNDTSSSSQITKFITLVVSGLKENCSLNDIYKSHSMLICKYGHSEIFLEYLHASSTKQFKPEYWHCLINGISSKLDSCSVLKYFEKYWSEQRRQQICLYDMYNIEYIQIFGQLIIKLLLYLKPSDDIFGLVLGGIYIPWFMLDINNQPMNPKLHEKSAILMATNLVYSIKQYSLLKFAWLTIVELSSKWTTDIRDIILPTFYELNWENFNFDEPEIYQSLVIQPRYFILKIITKLPLDNMSKKSQLLPSILSIFIEICVESPDRDDILNLLINAKEWRWILLEESSLMKSLNRFKEIYSPSCLLSERSSLHYGIVELLFNITWKHTNVQAAIEYTKILVNFISELSGKNVEKSRIIFANFIQKSEEKVETIPHFLSTLNVCEPSSEKYFLQIVIDWSRGNSAIIYDIIRSSSMVLASLDVMCQIIENCLEYAYELDGYNCIMKTASFFQIPLLGEFDDSCVRHQAILTLILLALQSNNRLESITKFTRKLRDLKVENEPKLILLWKIALETDSYEFGNILDEISKATTPNSILVTLRLKSPPAFSQKLRLFAHILASNLGKSDKTINSNTYPVNLKVQADFGKRLIAEKNKGCLECLNELFDQFYTNTIFKL